MSTRPVQSAVQQRTTVAVAPDGTVVLAAVDVKDWNWLLVEIINDDGAQDIAGVLESSTSASGPWSAQGTQELASILHGSQKNPCFDVSGLQFVRVTAYASGVGCNCRVAAWRGH